MIPENREQDKYIDEEECIQRLNDYLRSEVSLDDIEKETIKNVLLMRLALKAKDMKLKYKDNMCGLDYLEIAEKAINRFKENQENKPEDDKRGKHSLFMSR